MASSPNAAVTQPGTQGHQNWMNLPAALSSTMPTSTYSTTVFQPEKYPAKRLQ